jgi:phosphoglycolate phosphatase-like HAD superfamily hydrolase
MLDSLILDLDGPILDGRQRQYRCYSDIVLELGGLPLAIDEYWSLKRKRIDHAELLCRSGGVPSDGAFQRAWLERIELPDYLRLDVVQTGVRETLSAWRHEGRRLILATMRQSESNLIAQLSSLTLLEFFEYVVQVRGNTATAAKDKASEVARRVPNLGAGGTLWIGDTEVDLEAGRAVGTVVALVGCGIREASWLATLDPDFLEDDLPALEKCLKRCHM